MAVCSCQCSPCACGCPAPPMPCTYCDRDRKNNVWIEGVTDENGNGGICLLDTMTESQVINVLQRDERAREDLLRVTTNPFLLSLAHRVKRFPTKEAGDQLQTEINRNADSIPFYSVFRGQPPFAQ